MSFERWLFPVIAECLGLLECSILWVFGPQHKALEIRCTTSARIVLGDQPESHQVLHASLGMQVVSCLQWMSCYPA